MRNTLTILLLCVTSVLSFNWDFIEDENTVFIDSGRSIVRSDTIETIETWLRPTATAGFDEWRMRLGYSFTWYDREFDWDLWIWCTSNYSIILISEKPEYQSYKFKKYIPHERIGMHYIVVNIVDGNINFRADDVCTTFNVYDEMGYTSDNSLYGVEIKGFNLGAKGSSVDIPFEDLTDYYEFAISPYTSVRPVSVSFPRTSQIPHLFSSFSLDGRKIKDENVKRIFIREKSVRLNVH